MQRSKWFFRTGLTGLVCATILTFLAQTWWFFELFSHYTPYYALLSLLFGTSAMLHKSFKTALASITLCVVNLATFAPYLLTEPPSFKHESSLSILSQNFYYEATDIDAFLNLVLKENPDFIVVHEASNLWETAQESLRAEYPYLALTKKTGIHGIFMASRISGSFSEIALGQETGLLFTTEDQNIHILGVHPEAPLNSSEARNRNEQFEAISNLAQNTPEPLVVVGDFNSTPWSPHFIKLLRTSGLRDARLGFGLTPTWHAHNPLFWLPIDHALVSSRITVQNFYTTTPIDSDHRGIVLDLSL